MVQSEKIYINASKMLSCCSLMYNTHVNMRNNVTFEKIRRKYIINFEWIYDNDFKYYKITTISKNEDYHRRM